MTDGCPYSGTLRRYNTSGDLTIGIEMRQDCDAVSVMHLGLSLSCSYASCNLCGITLCYSYSAFKYSAMTFEFFRKQKKYRGVSKKVRLQKTQSLAQRLTAVKNGRRVGAKN